MEQWTSTLMELQDELAYIDHLIETAAIDEDVVEFSRLTMRKAALPALIREAKAKPIREEIARLEEERAAADDEMRRIQEGPEPDVPPQLRGQVTSTMVRRQQVTGLSSRSSSLSREIRDARARLKELEG